MTLWLNRAGSRGQHESKFLDDSRIYLTWEGLRYDLSKIDKPALRELLQKMRPDAKVHKTASIWHFVHEMKLGDWVVVPIRMKTAIHIAEITGPYVFQPDAEDPYYHYRAVKWIATDIPRSNFARTCCWHSQPKCRFTQFLAAPPKNAFVRWRRQDGSRPAGCRLRT